MSKLLPPVVVLSALMLPAMAHADIYRCIGADGKTLYSDSPCPDEAVRKLNISSNVGLCSSAECETKRAEQTAAANERLRADKQELQALAQQRRQNEIARLEEARLRQSLEPRLTALTDDSDDTGIYPAYAVYPAYPFAAAGRPCGRRCAQPHHSHNHSHQPVVHDGSRGRGVALKDR